MNAPIKSLHDPRAPKSKAAPDQRNTIMPPMVLGHAGGGGPHSPPSPWRQHGSHVSYKRGAVVGEPPGGNKGDGTLNARGLFVDGVPVSFGNFVDETGDTMTGPLTMSGAAAFITLNADPVAALHATPKQYVDDLVGALVAGVHMMGVFDATASTITWNSDTGLTGDALPDPATVTDGGYLICAVGGDTPPTGSPPDPLYNAGDWLISNGVDAWFHIFLDNEVIASDVVVAPPVAGQDDAQSALEALNAAIVALEAALTALEAATLPDAPSNGLTYGRKDAAWSIALDNNSVIDSGEF